MTGILTVGTIAALVARAVAAAPANGDHPGRTCLSGGQIVDPARRTVTAADIVIEGERIVRIGPGAAAQCGGRTVDARGKFVMPGLIDLHVHSWGNPAPTDADDDEPGTEAVAQLILRAGVMAMLDLGGDSKLLFPLRDRLRGSAGHAELRAAGVVFLSDRFKTEEDVRAAVRKRVERHPDVIKIIPGAHPDFGPAIDEARKLHLKTVVHISTWNHARAAVRAGATAITHFEDEVVIPDDVVRLIAEHRTLIMPTMTVQCEFARLHKTPALLDDPLLARLSTPRLLRTYRQHELFTRKAMHTTDWQEAGCVAHDFVSLRKLRDAGVTILAGSDTGNLGTFQGYSIHREMAWLVEAGLPAWDALRAATTAAAAFLEIPWGVEPGAPANLIVLDGSPVTDIRNTTGIRQVVYRGVVLTPR